MTAREGSLEAPTRHPLDWKNPEFHDESRALDEMQRVFEICHGCRRCLNLCNTFPTLFDLIDDSATGEVDAVDRKEYWNVVDQCYLCDICYMTKCPYVPPHPWNVDFPHVMLRGKAIQFRRGTATKFRDTTLSATDRNGKLAAIPIVAQTVNALDRSKGFRSVLEKGLGVHREAWLPDFAPRKFRSQASASTPHAVRDGERTPGKVAVYATCYVNYNEPGIGKDLLAVLEHNEIPFVLVQGEACCGMPKLELGDLESVEKLQQRNVPALAKLARDGYAILAPIPSCALMYKQELPLLFPDDENVLAVRDAMFDPFEFFALRARDRLLKTDFSVALGNVSYHVPCHMRVQNVGQKTREVLQSIPGTTVNTIERCSGHAGTWGVKKEYHEIAMKIGRPVFRQMAEHPNGELDWVASDCALAGHHIAQGMGKAGRPVNDKLAHPLTLLRMAYGLQE